MKSPENGIIVLLLVALVYLFAGLPVCNASADGPVALPILQKWSGDYPVSQIDRLPQGQTKTAAGYIDDQDLLERVWEAFRPGEPVPEIDFDTRIVVFCRNLVFYNRVNIVKVTLADGIAQIIAAETLSALPIVDKVAMSMAVISRSGVKFIQAGTERIDVPAGK
jgi:hypothetical protein